MKPLPNGHPRDVHDNLCDYDECHLHLAALLHKLEFLLSGNLPCVALLNYGIDSFYKLVGATLPSIYSGSRYTKLQFSSGHGNISPSNDTVAHLRLEKVFFKVPTRTPLQLQKKKKGFKTSCHSRTSIGPYRCISCLNTSSALTPPPRPVALGGTRGAGVAKIFGAHVYIPRSYKTNWEMFAII
ncbi:unnamed protein product [Trypanosoma congolense IL3000]|uniref:WGS project CAEQ00000000 data, annotated contig 1296 n=1 Tax=Trypanosoma congolense (strain IL3000) TaxID=1068625 RepID=F9W591_TRYCI|nr:unnamed protein product [Trypanosoma congolense IL3000]